MNSRSRGLTLLEMLVVLVLVGMVSTLIFQGYGYMLAVYQRIEQRQAGQFNRFLGYTWFRGTLENLVAYSAGVRRFRATSQELQGVTFSPLLSRQGVPTRFVWRLVRERDKVQLLYIERNQSLIIGEWNRPVQAEFSFLNEQGQWATTWSVGDNAHLPRAVRLLLDGVEEPELSSVTAVVLTRRTQRMTEALSGVSRRE